MFDLIAYLWLYTGLGATVALRTCNQPMTFVNYVVWFATVAFASHIDTESINDLNMAFIGIHIWSSAASILTPWWSGIFAAIMIFAR